MRLISFDGTRKEVDINEKEIKSMIVAIVSGDEVVCVTYKDGNVKKYDSDDGNRLVSLFDDFYLVEKKHLNKFKEAEINAIDADDRREKFESWIKSS